MQRREERLARVSRKQFGLITRMQLLEIGYTGSGITRARSKGELMCHLPGVWRVAAVPASWEQRPLGAVLWGGPVTVTSHLTSAQVQGLLPRQSGVIEITSSHRLRRRSGISIYSSRLRPTEMVNVRGIPCTSVYRTLIDLCALQPDEVSEAALDAALRMKRVTIERLNGYADEASGRSLRGARMLHKLLSVRGNDEALTESEAEHLFVRLMRRAGLPIGLRQSPREGVRNGRIDFFYPEQNLVIEVDGRKWHAGRREQRRDKRYDNELNISGRRVLRVTWEDLRFDEDYTLDVVARALGFQRLF